MRLLISQSSSTCHVDFGVWNGCIVAIRPLYNQLVPVLVVAVTVGFSSKGVGRKGVYFLLAVLL